MQSEMFSKVFHMLEVGLQFDRLSTASSASQHHILPRHAPIEATMPDFASLKLLVSVGVNPFVASKGMILGLQYNLV